MVFDTEIMLISQKELWIPLSLFLLWEALFQMTVVSLNICWNLPVKPLDLRLAGWLVFIRRYLIIYAFIKTVIFYFILS